MKVKICGITNYDDAKLAIDLGAWALGFNFYEKSPRFVNPVTVKEIIKKLGPKLALYVGVFVDAESKRVEEVFEEARLTTLQFHGQETPEFCKKFSNYFKAFAPSDEKHLEGLKLYSKASAFLIDAKNRGTGELANWDLATKVKKVGKVILAGGLTPQNVSEAIKKVQPFALDVTSGVEREYGKKDHNKMAEFFRNADTI